MFKIEMFVDDKALAPTLKALAQIGGVYEVKQQPVIEAQAKNGKVSAKESIRGLTPPLSAVARGLKAGQEVYTSDLKELTKKTGMSEISADYVVKSLCRAKVLKRLSPGVFRVLPH